MSASIFVSNLPHDLKAVDSQMHAWGRWCNSGNGSSGRCGSAEGRYLPPRIDDEKAEREAREPLDVVACELVDRAWRMLPNGLMRIVSADVYVHAQSKAFLIRKHGLVNEVTFDAYVRAVLRNIANWIAWIKEREQHTQNMVPRGLANHNMLRYGSPH